ncbi:MAG: FAD-binding protein, partial [Syntrophales bacterium]|nr:FAD-binding protein [Syntrophales bacterium]
SEAAVTVLHERKTETSVNKNPPLPPFGKGGMGGFLYEQDLVPCRCPVFHAEGKRKVVVVGSGPAGLFAALTLAEKGIPVLLLERGKPISERCRDVQNFWERGELDGESNVHFGEGGAGAFSDGKLTSRAKNPNMRFIKETLVELGAQSDILIDAKPHIGTDRLRNVAVNFREKLRSLGCEIRFGAKVSDFLIRAGRVAGIVVNGEEEVGAGCLIMAAGQNAGDTYAKLHEGGVQLAPKPFAMGLRVEHPQELINEIQYGKWRRHPALPPPDYFLTAKASHPPRSVYTFCMCPGGRIIGCSSSPGGIVTNGMSGSLRDGFYANSAVVVNVTIDDFSGTPQEPLKGLAFRRYWEEKAFSLGGGNYCAPAERLTDFLQDRENDRPVSTSFLPGIKAAPLRETLPPFVTEALKVGLRQFGTKMPGFVGEEAVLVGVETRTSSPVRILRDANGQSVNTAGLYPCGEGAGYAGGIISSALDGIRAAENVIASRGVRQ